MHPFSQEDLSEAARALTSTIGKCEKIEPKFALGTASHTLLTRRLRALRIAVALIERELGERTRT